MKPKYKVGDTVYFVNGSDGEQKCTVLSFSLGYQSENLSYVYTEPVYEIRWQPSGWSVESESRLTPKPRTKKAEAAS